MKKGKIAAQVGHGSVLALLGMKGGQQAMLQAWLSSGQRKICVKGTDESHLSALESKAKALGLPTARVHDAGHTQIPAGSFTVLAIGPGEAEAIDGLTGDLPLL